MCRMWSYDDPSHIKHKTKQKLLAKQKKELPFR